MTNSYIYSIKVNEALESYGARTHGSLARRVERLKRFTDMKNKQYADEIKVEHARMMARHEREERVKNRLRELKKDFPEWYTGPPGTLDAKPAPVFLKRNLPKEVEQVVEIPMTTSRRPSHSYNLRSNRQSYRITTFNDVWRAIQNGFVNTNRG